MAAEAEEVDVGRLSENEQLALQQYMSVTDQNVEAAIPLLRRSQWNVQIAIAKFFDGESADPVAEAQASIPPPRQSTRRETLLDGSSAFSPRSSSSSSRPRFDPAPRVVPQPDSQSTYRPPFLLALIFTPFQFLYRLLRSSAGILSSIFPFLPRLFGTQPGSQRSSTGRRALSPRDTAARFIREFEEEYGPNELPFVESGYAQAYDRAKADLKFLVVVLLSSEHDDTPGYVRDTLLAPEVVEYLKNPANEIILWAGNVQDSEAYQVATSLNCTKFPFAAVVSHTPQASSTAMSTIARVTGPLPPGTFVAKLRDAIGQQAAALHEARTARASRQAERNLREEQNSAYERSLAQDRERARQRREAEKARVQAEKEDQARVESEARKAQITQHWKRWRGSKIAPEPPSEETNTTRLSIRLPSGDRVVRKFAASVSVEEVYAFVECHDLPEQEQEKTPTGPPEDYTHVYPFQLVLPMPRSVFPPDVDKDVGSQIGRSANLIVESTDDIESAEDD